MEASKETIRVKKLPISVAENKLTVLIASPQQSKSATRHSKSSPRPIIYINGHNLRPKKDDDKVKNAYDIQVLADYIGCTVYSIIPSDNTSYSTQFTDGYPEGISLTQLHNRRAIELLGAIKVLQKKGIMPQVPVDVIGFSDGGILALTMIFEDPKAFRFAELVNTPGLDNKSTGKTYGYAFLEGGHVARSFFGQDA